MSRNILLLCAGLFLACNSQETTHRRVDTADKHQTVLSLNNGIKWKSDENTRTHVAKLNAEITAFNNLEAPDKEEYHALASAMQDELNRLISDCKMKGAKHDVLHAWLEPVLASVKELKNAGLVLQQAETVRKLTTQVQEFDQYFN